jgi:hypothetical protein
MKTTLPPVMSARTYHDAILQRAREIWHARGCPVGGDVSLWLEAERDLAGRGLIPPAPPESSHHDEIDEDELADRLGDFGEPPTRSATSLNPAGPPS